MADTKISALTAASALAGTEVLPTVQGGATVKATVQQIVTAATGATGMPGATVTASTPVINLSQTWNNSGVTFTADLVNVTDTASASASLLLDRQVAGVSKFNVQKNGQIFVVSGSAAAPTIGQGSGGTATGIYWPAAGYVTFAYGGSLFFGMDNGGNGLTLYNGKKLNFDPGTGSGDTGVARNAAGVLEVNNGTAGTFRDLKFRGAWWGSYLTVGTLPAAASSEGLTYRVSDSSAPSVGSTVAAGGSAKCTVRSDGTNWKVTEAF